MYPHICHITTSHPSYDTRIFSRECVGLAKKGYRVSLIARHPKRETIKGVEIFPLHFAGKFSRKFILPRKAARRALEINPDIIHFHDPELLPVMARIAKQGKIRVVWDVHELYTERIKEYSFKMLPVARNIVSHYFDRMEMKCAATFSGIITVTDLLAERYKKLEVPVQVIKNVVDIDSIPDAPPSKKANDVFSIIASGTTNEGRCIYELIEAFVIVVKHKPNCILQLLSRFDSPANEKKIRKHISRLNLAGRVKIKNLVAWEKLMSYEIPHADIGMVLYSKNSKNNLVGLPNRLFECWAKKTPVIATDTPLLKKIITETGGGICMDSNKPENIADAITFYVDNHRHIEEDGVKGYRVVCKKYCWKLELETLLGFYKHILCSSNRRGK